MLRAVLLGCLTGVWLGSAAAAAPPRVELEIAASPEFPGFEVQRWYRLLTDLKFDSLRIRQARAGDRVRLDNLGTAESPRYRAVGVLTARGELLLPGGRFSLADGGRLADWLDRVRAGGAEGLKPSAPPPRLPYNLTAAQLAQVRRDLARPVGFETAGLSPAEVVARVARDLDLPLSIDRAAAAALAELPAEQTPLDDLARGTALAYLLRAAGAGLEVQAGSDGLRYVVLPAGPGRQPWPVGLPPEHSAKEVLPGLLEVLEVQLDEVPIADVYRAVGQRLQVPVLYDRAALARHRIDPQRATASLRNQRMTYLRLLKESSGQVLLSCELRVDEAEKPFLWVTTLRP